ncbi:hypothetical protein GCM10027395_10900 [Giesbergeria sinuosa]
MRRMVMFAEGILKLHWNQSVPVDVAHIAQNMGIVLAHSPSPTAACAHLQISLQNQPLVTLGQHHHHERQRYALAQALGHVALHHLRPGLERSIEVSDDFSMDMQTRTERAAHQFALRLLIPESVLRFCVQDLAMSDLLELAHVFDVPAALMGWRLMDWPLPAPSPPSASAP